MGILLADIIHNMQKSIFYTTMFGKGCPLGGVGEMFMLQGKQISS